MGMGITTTHLSVKPSFLTFSKWEQARKESKTFIFRTTARQREAHKVFVRSKKSYSAKRKKHARPPLPATPPHLHDKLCYYLPHETPPQSKEGREEAIFPIFSKKENCLWSHSAGCRPSFPTACTKGGGDLMATLLYFDCF